jgi:sarcosine oxidase subunit gamma
MSDPAGALGGARFHGLVDIAELPPRGMITLRGDLSTPALGKAASDLAGVDFPGQRGASVKGERGLLWLSPDEVMVLLPRAEAAAGVATLSAALKGTHHMAVDVSDARSLFRLSNGPVREVLAKLTPADLHPESFGPGEVRRTRLAQVAAAFWMPDAGTVEVMAFRSVAVYVFDLLSNAAAADARVDLF